MNWLWIFGVIVILLLAAYAAYLLWQLRSHRRAQRDFLQQQREQQARQQQAYDQQLVQSIRVIANATLQEQCELSEAALRICKLLAQVPAPADGPAYPERFPALYELNQVISHHPILQARKQLGNQERMKLDLERYTHEGRLAEAIKQELPQLVEFKT